MRGTIVRIGATGAGALLALGLLAGPSAGAAGSDKADKDEQSAKVACFNAEGNTQGRSLSDPDGMENGGADKPGCTHVGARALDDDQDGNNGCGNDADREDDNNGNCGGENAQGPSNDEAEEAGDDDTKVKPEKVDADVTVQAAGSVSAAAVPAVDASTTTPDAATTVSASGDTAPAAAESTTPGTQVLGVTLSAPDTLARTGAGVGGLALLGGLLLGGGRLTVLARRLLRIG